MQILHAEEGLKITKINIKEVLKITKINIKEVLKITRHYTIRKYLCYMLNRVF